MFSQAMPMTMSSSLLQSRVDFSKLLIPQRICVSETLLWFHNIAARLEPFDTNTFAKNGWEGYVIC